jgi:hypothetical protein
VPLLFLIQAAVLDSDGDVTRYGLEYLEIL